MIRSIPSSLVKTPPPKKGDIPPDLAQGTSISGATKFASNSSQVICAGDLLSWGLRGLPSKVQCFNSLLIKNHGYFGMGQTLVDPHFLPSTSPSPLTSVILPCQSDAKASQLRLGDGNEHMMSINVMKSD